MSNPFAHPRDNYPSTDLTHKGDNHFVKNQGRSAALKKKSGPKGSVHQSKLFSGKNKTRSLKRIGTTEYFKDF